MVALVRGVHGLRGSVRVEVLTDRPDQRFVPGATLYQEGRDEPLTIDSAEEIVDGPGWRLHFRELTTRDVADTIRGVYLEAVVRPDEDLTRGSYYWHEVIGSPVLGVDRAELGTVQDIYRVGETEVLVVSGGRFGSFDVPAVRAFIRTFAPRRGEIVVDAEALDLRPAKILGQGKDRPKAPRRRSRGSRTSPTSVTDAPGPLASSDSSAAPADSVAAEPADSAAAEPASPLETAEP